MSTTTCPACHAHEVAFKLRSTEYHSPRHIAALDLALSLGHAGCSLDSRTPLADRMLVTFG
jgi:hypothetical protein